MTSAQGGALLSEDYYLNDGVYGSFCRVLCDDVTVHASPLNVCNTRSCIITLDIIVYLLLNVFATVVTDFVKSCLAF